MVLCWTLYVSPHQPESLDPEIALGSDESPCGACLRVVCGLAIPM